MKITVWSWEDKRWNADKETLKAINEMIKKEKKVKTLGIGDKAFYVLGCIALSPFIIKDLIIQGFKKIRKKIKK
tara:strand:- start:170 stop:391 length:222 start_codon:yes stop_codon:yes gene_type:complete